MGVFDRFERRLERLVEGTFAKVFKDEAQPADIAHALQRETDDRRVIVGPGHLIAPNAFVVELGDHDNERLSPYAEPLGEALAEMVQEHGREQGYSFVGPVQVRLEHDPKLDTGRFQVRSEPAAAVARADGGRTARPAPPTAAMAVPDDQLMPDDVAPAPSPPARRHRVVVVSQGAAPVGSRGAHGEEVSVPLTSPVTIIGRSASADLHLDDPGVSRRHAELQVTGDVVRLVDVGSTNGTTVNGEQVGATTLHEGDRIQVGGTVLVYRSDD